MTSPTLRSRNLHVVQEKYQETSCSTTKTPQMYSQISWSDRVSNVEVLRSADMECIKASLTGTQLRWCGHVVWMENHGIPHIALYGELQHGKRRRGGQKLR